MLLKETAAGLAAIPDGAFVISNRSSQGKLSRARVRAGMRAEHAAEEARGTETRRAKAALETAETERKRADVERWERLRAERVRSEAERAWLGFVRLGARTRLLCKVRWREPV